MPLPQTLHISTQIYFPLSIMHGRRNEMGTESNEPEHGSNAISFQVQSSRGSVTATKLVKGLPTYAGIYPLFDAHQPLSWI